jgi:hypothetical protein
LNKALTEISLTDHVKSQQYLDSGKHNIDITQRAPQDDYLKGLRQAKTGAGDTQKCDWSIGGQYEQTSIRNGQ